LLTLREWRLLAAVDGRRSVNDLAHVLKRTLPEIQRDLSNLAVSGLIRMSGGKAS
jgi:predicted transcriptional regulator